MSRFRIQFLSGLHLCERGLGKHPSTWVRPVAPRLALLGDIGRIESECTQKFLKYCDAHQDQVLWVPGYLELLGPAHWTFKLDVARRMIDNLKLRNTILATKQTEDVPGLTILATTLWHHPHPGVQLPWSYKKRPLNSNEINKIHDDEAAWLSKSIARHPKVLTLTQSPLYPWTASKWLCALTGKTDQDHNYSGQLWSTFQSVNDANVKQFQKDAFWEQDSRPFFQHLQLNKMALLERGPVWPQLA